MKPKPGGGAITAPFQSAPLTEARGDEMLGNHTHNIGGFNPLPLPKQGEIWAAGKMIDIPIVSIRSPYRSKGRFIPVVLEPYLDMFQSAPLTEARGDSLATSNPVCPTKFQSAPLTEARGDPHTPVAHRTDTEFQSAPLTEARGDRWFLTDRTWPSCFNPLPLPKQGEIHGSS